MALNLHPLSGSSFPNLIRLFRNHEVEFKYLPKALGCSLISLSSILDRQLARRHFDPQADQLTFREAPVFILGHWRSGTTYLHHLMSQDTHFSYVSSYQAWAPELFLQNRPYIRLLVERSLPKRRPFDNVELSMRKPEEEEFVMSNVTPHSFIHTFFFPKDTREIFRQSVLFERLSVASKHAWEAQYVRALKMAALAMGGNRPLVKSPANTARISTLLKLFPDAKFIHIYRNPFTVFFSQRHTCLKLIEMWKFQDISVEEVEDNILLIYKLLMQRYFEDKNLIPSDNLVELSYEDFQANPIEKLEEIYAQLEISDFEQVKHRLSSYALSKSSYQKNSYDLDPTLLDKIYSHWGFTIDRWGYPVSRSNHSEAQVGEGVLSI
ncbi:MAG: sulfotransferase [Cyanobacteria bacterium J06648_16]